jgi:serine/threonine protein kinase
VVSLPRSFGNYVIERELDRGGMAAVFLGRHRMLQRQVAVKVLLNQSEDQIERFRREAELTSQLRHQHIVEIYDHGLQGPFAYTVMEAAMGGSLRQKLENAPKQRLPLDEALRIFTQIGEALDFAHAKSIIHRDVTPGNILLDATGKRALLTDFGIARSEKQQSITTTHMVMGTPGYFSPEHLRGAKDVLPQSDIFALGLVLYAMLAGQLPWEGIPPSESAPQLPFKPLSQLANVLPAIDPIMLTLLAVDPNSRYQKASEAIDALRRVFPAQIGTKTVPVNVAGGRSLYLVPGFQSVGVLNNDVEQLLGPQLDRKVISRAHQRADLISQPEVLVETLETWSVGERFRRRNLGRLATFHEVESQNIYFYRLDVLYETRSEPFSWEQPDRERKPMSGTPEVGVWDMKLAEAKKFEADQGEVREITGSEQVSQCSKCNGKCNVLCNTCKGNGRITITQTVEQPVDVKNAEGGKGQATMTTVQNIVKPCPECKGKGFLTCPTCEGIGMVIRRKGFKWQRHPVQVQARDDLPGVDEAALEAEALEVYNKTFSTIQPEWRAIRALDELIDNVETATDAKTRIVLARLHIRMAPVTRVQFELGRRTSHATSVVVLADHDGDPDTAGVPTVQTHEDEGPPSEMKTLHLLGFNNTISVREAVQFRDWPRIMTLATIAFLALLVVIMLVFVLVVY